MNEKKRSLIHPGSRVRVADPLLQGDERWTNALPGAVAMIRKQDQGHGVLVLLDGESKPEFHLWTDVDVEAKPRPQLLDLPLAVIRPSRWQYRRNWDPDKLLELATSIRDHGLLNRLILFRDEDGGYELVAGERRLRACWALAMVRAQRHGSLSDAVAAVAAAGWWKAPPVLAIDQAETVPVELRAGAAADFREIVIVENMIRADPTPIEEAEAFNLLIAEEGYTQDRLAQRLGLLGLAAEVRATVESAEISFTAARAIATLPAAVQAPVTALVQKMAALEGDSAATSRKVQAMAAQVRKFLDPAHWADPPGVTLRPHVRNRLWLARRLIEQLPPERAGDILKLRHDDQSWAKSFLGMKPESLVAAYNFDEVVRTLTGNYNLEAAWRRQAKAGDRTCPHCKLRVVKKPAAHFDTYCLRWEQPEATTCENFTGAGDPVVMAIGDQPQRWVRELGLKGAIAEPFPHCDDPSTWLDIQFRAHAAWQAENEHRDARRRQQHVRPLREYWQAQNILAWGLLPNLHSFQAHACCRCYNYRPELLADNLPPCRLAVEPLKERWGDGTAAPDMGILVRDDGAMVPRCSEFRVAELPDIYPLEGFSIKPQSYARKSVIAWLERLCRVGSQHHTHNSTVRAPAAWLPYERPDDANGNPEAVARYVNRHWDEIGDGGVALLLDIALAEARATGKYQEPIQLLDADTGAQGQWCSVSWGAFVAGKESNSYSSSNAPDDWPKPWIGVERPQLVPDEQEAQ